MDCSQVKDNSDGKGQDFYKCIDNSWETFRRTKQKLFTEKIINRRFKYQRGTIKKYQTL